MKTTHLLATLIAATLPLTAIPAEDTGETTDQKQEQSSDTMGMKGKMMSNWKDQDAEVDKLVAEMNSRTCRQETRRCRGRFDQTGRTTQGDARAHAEDDVGQREGGNGYVPDDDGFGQGRRPLTTPLTE